MTGASVYCNTGEGISGYVPHSDYTTLFVRQGNTKSNVTRLLRFVEVPFLDPLLHTRILPWLLGVCGSCTRPAEGTEIQE